MRTLKRAHIPMTKLSTAELLLKSPGWEPHINEIENTGTYQCIN